jgi:hypothetical protein
MTITKIPTLQPINSSALKAAAYDPASQTMFIQFPSGNIYAYPEVSTDTWAAFQAAESKGKFYGQNIKGTFTGTPVKEDQTASEPEGSTAD